MKEELRYQKKALKMGKLIPGLNLAQSKEWREKRIKELEQKLKDAQSSKTIRRTPKG